MRRGRAERTRRRGRRRSHGDSDLPRGGVNVTRVEAQRGGIGEQAGKDCGGWRRDERGLLITSMMALGSHRCRVLLASGLSRVGLRIQEV